ncbi:hypothetical protein Fmac_008660 [Flemingia macrophylla]|uniref:Uncharacterized protein n=1 Tax=Flemingia macrophylla TaxID=520843 RepID=A0ABD1MY19_9FABA
MALLGMSANMQCNGYFPYYYCTGDNVFGAEGSTWTSSNGNSERKNDCYQIGSMPLSTCQRLGYNKELLKQTILKHEAIFRDQIHELHRIYQKQRELMDEIKRIGLHKHSLRLETSSSSSSLYYSQSLPWLTTQSSVLNAEGTLASMQEKSRQLCLTHASAPTAIKESLGDPKLLGSTSRKVGKKLLDLQLPADEYIDSEGESCENERVIKELTLSTYTINGISKVVYNTDVKQYGTKSNGFADLNLPFKLEEETGVKSDDLASIHHQKYSFHDIPGRMTTGSLNFPNDVIQNLKRKQDLETSAGKNGSDLDSFSKSNDIECVSKKLKQVNNSPCFHLMMVPGPTTERPAGTHDPPSGGRLGSHYASCTCAPHQLVSKHDMKSSRISPPVLWMSTASGPNLDCKNYLNRNFCSRYNPPVLASSCIEDLNSFDNCGSSSAGHELGKYAKDSEYVGTTKNINLNIMSAGYSDPSATTFQSIRITCEEKNLQDSRLPWHKAKPVPYEETQTSNHFDFSLLNHKSGCIHSDLKFNKVEKCDLGRDKILAFDLNGKPQTSRVFRSLTKNHWTEEITKILTRNSPCDSDPDMGEQVPASEQSLKNKKHLASVLDLNSCTNEDENTRIDNDLQAPVSPENKECSPPRGESDENQLEMPLQLLAEQEQEDPAAQEVQARTAAEALFSISAAADNVTTWPSSEPFVSSALHWFSGIVSTIVDHHSESGVKEDFSCTIKDLEDFLPADFDYFEFMSLNLTDTKDLDYCYKSSDRNEQEGGSTFPTQPRKCRTNRRRRGNNFQSEILPSLASLSRYEVTKDLQTIGGLVEAAKTHSAIGCPRSAGRNVLARGKRRSCASASNITHLLLNLKQLNINTEIGIGKRGFISWGKICRKQRGKRFPSSKPHFIFSQVHN